MPLFDAHSHRYPSVRNVVYAKNGMACSTQPLASSIGARVMRAGGNAIDAAVAMAGVMPLLEPTGNGLGSDAFFLVWTGGKLYGLNASGFSPAALSAQEVKRKGYDAVPADGWLPVMVPGAAAGWCELARRFGTMPLSALWEPAAEYAEQGFPVSPAVCLQWRRSLTRFKPAYGRDPQVFGPWMALFGRAPEPGQLFANPDYARTIRELAESAGESFYRGRIMKEIVRFSDETGGYLAEEDFTSYRPVWTEPIHASYRGYDVWEMPPNGHGITALMALQILEGFAAGAEKEDPLVYHRCIEAIKLAFADTKKYVADPAHMKTKVEDMLSPRYAAGRRALIGEEAILPEAGDPSCGDTVYFCCADGNGNMVSCIQSNYQGFGSGICIPGTGITLQDRGANFSMDPASDNYLRGGKRAYHTIIPGFLTKDGRPVGPFGVMGGFMQPQGHVQVLVNTIDYGMNPQEALDAPRFQWTGGKEIWLEKEVPEAVKADLAARGHEIRVPLTNLGMGRGQIIWRNDDGVLCGGTEPRSAGSIAVC